MRCAVKYCGGCNPRFDRVRFVRKLQEAFPQVTFEPVRQEIRADFAVIVCGCSSRCAKSREIPSGQDCLIVWQEECFDTVHKQITAILANQTCKEKASPK